MSRLPPACSLDRRRAVGGIGALALAGSAAGKAAAQVLLEDPGRLDRAIAEVTGGAPSSVGRLRLTMPALAENGNVVSLQVAADSPMTPEDHVRRIVILSEKNPVTHIATFRLGPRAGRVQVATNVRLAVTQRVVALAETSDGRYWRAEQNVVVTLAACINGG
jgi:sulfur-oxidizing protein SoxY